MSLRLEMPVGGQQGGGVTLAEMPGKPINVTLTSRGRMTLPRAVREPLYLGAGDKFGALTVAEMDAGIASAVALDMKAAKPPVGQLLR